MRAEVAAPPYHNCVAFSSSAQEIWEATDVELYDIYMEIPSSGTEQSKPVQAREIADCEVKRGTLPILYLGVTLR